MRLAVSVAALLLIAGGGGERPCPDTVPDCRQLVGADFQECAFYAADVIYWNEQCQYEQQQQMAIPQQLATPNAPTMQQPVVVVDGGDSSVAEWAALFSGLAALVGAFEVFRRRRKHDGPL